MKEERISQGEAERLMLGFLSGVVLMLFSGCTVAAVFCNFWVQYNPDLAGIEIILLVFACVFFALAYLMLVDAMKKESWQIRKIDQVAGIFEDENAVSYPKGSSKH